MASSSPSPSCHPASRSRPRERVDPDQRTGPPSTTRSPPLNGTFQTKAGAVLNNPHLHNSAPAVPAGPVWCSAPSTQ